MGGRQSKCLVRNQSNRNIDIICRGSSDENSKYGDFHTARVMHGHEHPIEAPFFDGKGITVAFRFAEEETASLVQLPNAATLFLRSDQNEVSVRIFSAQRGAWEAAACGDGTAFFSSPDNQSRECDHRAYQQEPVSEAINSTVTPSNDKEPQAPLTRSDQIPSASSTSSPNGQDAVRSQGQVPVECLCPISHEIFEDPVLAADGFTYERACIEEWYQRRGPRSPMIGKQVSSTTLTPNLAIRALSEQYRGWGACQARTTQKNEAGFYTQHLPALIEMFGNLSEEVVCQVCAGLSAQGVEDLDACIRQLLERARQEDGDISAVSLAPVCMAAGTRESDVATAAAILDPAWAVPDSWSVEQEELFASLLSLLVAPVRARKAIDMGCVETLEEAILWLELHQEDVDIDTPVEVLEEHERVGLAMDVLRVATIPALHRLHCFQALHQVLRRILEDPESERVRKLRIRNSKFREKIGRFPPAVALLRRIGFKKGDFWVTAFEKEPCLEFTLPVDSDNILSQRFVRAYSLIDEVLRAPDDWLPLVAEALPEVQSEWAKAEVELQSDNPSFTPAPDGALPSREYLAEMHKRRVENPRGFQEAMRAAGKQPNRTVVDVRSPAPEITEDSARALAGAASSSGSGSAQYRRLSERFQGRRHFDLEDIEAMRVEDAIAARPQYAREYDGSKGSATSYGELLTRSYDPQYLGRKAVDDSNTFRAQQCMPPLRWSQALADIAEEHAKQMARGEMPFSHKGFEDRVKRYPFAHFSAAENLAYNGGVADAAGVAVQGWIKSPGHRKNLLGAFDLCGVGAAQARSGEFFFTQLFARTAGGALC